MNNHKLLDMTLDEQMNYNNRRNSRDRRRRYRDWDNTEHDTNYDGTIRSRQRRRYNQHYQPNRSSSLNYRNRNRSRNRNRFQNNNNYDSYNYNHNNNNNTNNYRQSNHNRSHSNPRRHHDQYNIQNTHNRHNVQTYDDSHGFDVNVFPQNEQFDYQYTPTNNNNVHTTNNDNNNHNNISTLYNEYKVNEWIANQEEIQKCILTDTIGLQFDIGFYTAGLIKNNHGWRRGDSFEAEHEKFCVAVDENESKYVKMKKLATDYPVKEYQRRTNETKYHYKKWGQRKLLMTEIQFLSSYFDLSEVVTVVYAGAAPGHHTPFLADLFPNISFELWDPACFHEANFAHKRILVNNGCTHHHLRSRKRKNEECCYFTDEIAKKYGVRVKNGEKILFISDIRTADWRKQNQLDVEDFVLRDNELQFNWVKYINPFRAHLKFRCPYPDRVANLDKYEYFGGRLYFQAWLAPTSTEMRLVVEKNENKNEQLKEYNIHKYEQQLFWWNNVARQTYIKNPYYFAPIGFVNTYDCYLEAMILEKYFKKMFQFSDNNYDVLKYLIPLTVHRITKMLSPNGNKTLLTRFKGITAHRQIDHTKHYQEMDDDKKRKEKTKRIEKTHLNTLRFNNNRNQKQLETREYTKELIDIKYATIIKYLKEHFKINDIKELLIDRGNTIDNKIEIVQTKLINTQNNKYKIFYHNNTTHFSLFISITGKNDEDEDDDNILNLCGCFIVDFSNDKIQIFELMENHPYLTFITQSFHLLNTKSSRINETLITVILGKFIYNFDVPNADKQDENKEIKEDDYEFLVHDVLVFNSTTNDDFESRIKCGDQIVKNFNNNIGEIRNIRFVLLSFYDINDIISMYCNFKYFGALNGPTAWNSSFKKDDFTMNDAVRGGILAKDDKIDKNSKYCKITKCNGLSIINVSSNVNLLWSHDKSYSLIGLNTNLNTNPMLMATNMDECRKSLLYDLNKEKVVGFCTIPRNFLTFEDKEYILVDACIKEIYKTQIDYNTNIEIYEKEISIDGIHYGLGVEYFVSYLPERMDYNENYYNKVKENIVYEIDVIEWSNNKNLIKSEV